MYGTLLEVFTDNWEWELRREDEAGKGHAQLGPDVR